ncbi:MAG: hypothetical protein HY002_02325 [Candidatus Rokubacteria bacterium]|nr:hypothetical protein [Candidatus Rokubacteria bacterium]
MAEFLVVIVGRSRVLSSDVLTEAGRRAGVESALGQLQTRMLGTVS